MKKIIKIIVAVASIAALYFTILNFDSILMKINNTHKVRSVNENKMDNSQPNEVSYDKLLDIKYRDAIGWLIIPQEGVGVSLPITAGLGGNNMLYGAGEQYSRDVIRPGQIGNYVLASHYTPYPGTLFTNLNQTKVGSQVYVADNKYVYVYNVTLSIVEDINSTSYEIGQTSNPTNADITLYTCSDIYATKRYIVKGTLSNKIKISKADKNLKEAFKEWIAAQ